MRLRKLNFDQWLASHRHKDAEERWLRELYPWPVFAQVDCDEGRIGQTQLIRYGDVPYEVTLRSATWQPRHGTYRYRVLVESEGLGWHSRSFSDLFDICGAPNGEFVTLFHVNKKEPLEKIAKSFFARRWDLIDLKLFGTLAVSRFLAASIVAHVVVKSRGDEELVHYPTGRLLGGLDPMYINASGLWIGHRFFSEDAFNWARLAARHARSVLALYFADSKYQFRTDLPANANVLSISELDASHLDGEFEQYIRILLRRLELPSESYRQSKDLESVLRGEEVVPAVPVREGDVHESLAALKCPCNTKSDLRYQLAAAVVLNAWIEQERRIGYPQRKKFYAFKQRVGEIINWAFRERMDGVCIWVEDTGGSNDPIVYVRVDDVDFSFHAIPNADVLSCGNDDGLVWKGVRLKPISPLVLEWARALRH